LSRRTINIHSHLDGTHQRITRSLHLIDHHWTLKTRQQSDRILKSYSQQVVVVETKKSPRCCNLARQSSLAGLPGTLDHHNTESIQMLANYLFKVSV